MTENFERKLKVLLVIEQCNPEWASVPLVGFNFFDQINKFADVTLVTHARNKEALEKLGSEHQIRYIHENPIVRRYYNFASKIANIGGNTNWPLYHLLTYPVYWDFDRKVYKKYKIRVRAGEYDIVHSITPMMPRYPVKLIKACKDAIFILGPVNGGVPFPVGFEATARKESAHFNFLRAVGRNLLIGYRKTYKNADLILSGSSYTLNMLRELFGIPSSRIQLFFENGVPEHFFQNRSDSMVGAETTKLLFVGRLVPYKGADMLIDAIAKLPSTLLGQLHLTIVGDGSERNALQRQIENLGLPKCIEITGWIPHEETRAHYQNADIFCFPSIREFGGAVVLEAMASGLPCIVVNNGGIGEYVTEAAGFRIEPKSRAYIVDQLAELIEKLVLNAALRISMSNSARLRAQLFKWDEKGLAMHKIYKQLVHQD